MHDDTPAKVAIKVSLDPNLKRKRGRPVHGFVNSLKKDVMNYLDFDLDITTLERLKLMAFDKKTWITFILVTLGNTGVAKKDVIN